MAEARKTGNFGITAGVDVIVLREAEQGFVSRFLVHVTAVAGTITSQARLIGDSATRITATNVYPLGSTTAASTITATGLYVVDAAGLDCALSSGTSCTLSYLPIVG